MPTILNGQLEIAPAAVVTVDDSALNGTTLGGSGAMACIGECDAGIPATPLAFNSATQAIQALVSGPLLDQVRRAFRLSADIPGAPLVYAVRVNQATQSRLNLNVPVTPLASPAAPTLVGSGTGGTLPAGTYNYRVSAVDQNGETLASAEAAAAVTTTGTTSSITVNWVDVAAQTNSGPISYNVYGRTPGAEVFIANVAGTSFVDNGSVTPVTAHGLPTGNTTGLASAISLLSSDYGALTRQVRVSLQAGINGLGYDVSVAYGNTINERPQVYRNALSIALVDLTSAYTAATAQVTGTTLTLTTTPAGAGPYVIDLTSASTLQAVANAVNALGGGWQAAVTGYNGDDSSLFLDENPTAVPVRVTTTTAAPVPFMANNKAVMDFFNLQSGFVTAKPGVTRQPPAFTNGWVYLGSDSVAHRGTDFGFDTNGNLKTAVNNADWQAAMDSLLPINLSIVTVATSDQTIHGMLQGHVNQASSEGSERIMLVGGDSGETISAAQNRAASFRDPRVGVVWPGGFDIDPIAPFTGQTIAVPPYQLAAQLGGMFCGGDVSAALTQRYLSLKGVEIRLSKGDIDTLLEYGVIPIRSVPNKGQQIVQSRSTYIADDNYRRNELSTMRCSDELSKILRTAAEDRILGRVNSPQTLQLAKSVMDTELRFAQMRGIIVGNATTPAYQNLNVYSVGNQLYVDVQCLIAVPINYISITTHLGAFSGSA